MAPLPSKKPNELDANGMKVLFLHGWHSIPGGIKPTYLAKHGLEVINPKLDDDDFAAAINAAQLEFNKHRPEVVVGSSRGGAVAMNIDSAEARLVLLCPAWKRWGNAKQVRAGTIILHSQADDIIPYDNSIELARNSNATLIEVGHDHRLADEASLSALLWACELAATDELLPFLDDETAVQAGSKANVGEEATYLCDACGEEIVVPLDLTEGSHQTYVEDCPVCCRANIIHVHVDEQGHAIVYAEPEQN